MQDGDNKQDKEEKGGETNETKLETDEDETDHEPNIGKITFVSCATGSEAPDNVISNKGMQ